MALAARGPTTATGLAGLLPISRQAITKHLELLAAAGLVLAEPGELRRIRYRVNAAPMAIAQSYLAALIRDWDSKLARLQRSLDAPAPQPEARAHALDWQMRRWSQDTAYTVSYTIITPSEHVADTSAPPLKQQSAAPQRTGGNPGKFRCPR